MTAKAIFLDDSGVMNDNTSRSIQWNLLISEYFKPRYGGESEEWMNANTYAMKYVIDILDSMLEKNSLSSHKKYRTLEHKIWIEKMFEYTHIPCPPKEKYEKLHLDVEAWITPQVHSAYPGITDVIQRLSKTYTLHTASNESSQMLDAYLRGLNDVHECFQILFGPDSY